MSTKPFIPSSSMLTVMLAGADAKFESAREQALLAKEARADARMERMLVAEAKGRAERFWGPR